MAWGVLAFTFGTAGAPPTVNAIWPGCEVNVAALIQLVDAAYADIKARLGT